MAIAASGGLSGVMTNSNNPTTSNNFLQQVPKQYRMYLGASVVTN